MSEYEQMDELFSSAYRKAKPIEFNAAWIGDLGHLDFIVDSPVAPKVIHGKIMRSDTPMGNRVLIIGTKVGNLAVYDFGDANETDKLFATSMSPALQQIFMLQQDVSTLEEMESILGNVLLVENVGVRIDNLLKAIKFEEEALF